MNQNPEPGTINPEPHSLDTQFGSIDIYWFDQILRGRAGPLDTILDAGCGFGRNLVYPMRQGWQVFGIDQDPDAIGEVQRLAQTLAPTLPPENFRVSRSSESSFPDGFATVVLSSAVLHFARGDAEFDAMLTGTWRLLAPGGMFFCRLASTIGDRSSSPAARPEPAAGIDYPTGPTAIWWTKPS